MCILLVEDNLKLVSMLEEVFGQVGFMVDCVYDGYVVDLLFIMQDYVFVIFDIGLLCMDGLEVLCCLCVCKNLLFVMILIVYGVVEECVCGLNFGVDDYFVKLFDLIEVEVCVWVFICCSYGYESMQL